MKNKVKSIGILTTGGDAPGMNTAIRAAVRMALHHKIKVWGIERGWYGLINGLFVEMDSRSVSGIINKGGTILYTRRCPEFHDKKERAKAFKELQHRNIDALVVIGGNGSLSAAGVFSNEFNLPINVIPASIDNDIPCTDYTIGYDTAVNTALDSIDKIRDTATSHERLFVVQVMGRENGFIALDVALASGAEAVLIPEKKYSLNVLVKTIKRGQAKGKESFIIVAAEGAGDINHITNYLSKELNIEVRLSILGHVQRGGSPTAFSRELACKMGGAAVELLLKGKAGLLIGVHSDRVKPCRINQVLKTKKRIDSEQLRLTSILSS